MASGLFAKARQKFLNPNPTIQILSTSYADPVLTINTDGAHYLTNGDRVALFDITAITPSTQINAVHAITYVDSDTFTISSAGLAHATATGHIALSDALLKKHPNIIRWTRDDIKLCIVDTDDFVEDLATNEFLSDVSAGIIDTSTVLLSKTATDGIADAADIIVTTVAGDQSEAIIIFKDTGTAATSPLIAYFDSAASANLPFTPNGGDVTITFSNGTNKIFKL